MRGQRKTCIIASVRILVGGFWVVVTLFALLFWGTVAYVAWAFIAKAW